MYYKLEDRELEKINRVAKITLTDYELVNNFISVENMMAAIEDLLSEIDNLEEKIKDREQEIEDNYRPISVAEQYGINDRDFY